MRERNSRYSNRDRLGEGKTPIDIERETYRVREGNGRYKDRGIVAETMRKRLGGN